MTVPYLLHLPEKGWVKDITLIPDIDDHVVKEYLLSTKLFKTKSEAKVYKTHESYKMLNNVHSLRINYSLPETKEFFVVRGLCNPSQRTSGKAVKALFIIFHRQAFPLTAYCTCAAG